MLALALLSLVSLFFVEETKKFRLLVIAAIAAWLIFELRDADTHVTYLVLPAAIGLHYLLAWNDDA